MLDKQLRRYRRMAIITVSAVILLILVGGIVRMTGSGMGCPDWPKCFGVWVPPTSVEQLPANYQEIYKESYQNTEFNVFKTWTEYINRLIGVLIGFFIFLTLLWAYPLRKLQKGIFSLSLIGFFLVLIEGGLGGMVVRSNLHLNLITLHMVLSLILLGVLITATLRAYDTTPSQPNSPSKDPFLNYIGIFILLLITLQIVLGTQVREGVDTINKALGEASRERWIGVLENDNPSFNIHKYLHWLMIPTLCYWVYRIRVAGLFLLNNSLRWAAAVAIFCIVLEAIFGVLMYHLAIPPILQPLHLLFATLLFAAVYIVWAKSK